MSFFLSRGQDRSGAEELTQRTFLRLLGAERDYVDNPDGFVFRVAASLIRDDRDCASRRAMAGAASLDDEAIPLAAHETLTPERILMARDRLAQVARGLGELDERTRKIILLFRIEGVRQREIADQFGMTTAAVQKQILRATARLAAYDEGGRAGCEPRCPSGATV